MTEDQYQEARKIMRVANGLRSSIVLRKAEVAKWTAMESAAIGNMQPNKAVAFKKFTLQAIKKLDEAKKKFEELDLPPKHFKSFKIRCIECGVIIDNNQKYCEEHKYLE